MSRYPDRRQVDAATNQLRASAAIDQLDHTAGSMEARWGVGRLRLLVDLDLATRFDRQRDKLRHAIAADDPILMVTHVTGMQRAWVALDAAAPASLHRACRVIELVDGSGGAQLVGGRIDLPPIRIPGHGLTFVFWTPAPHPKGAGCPGGL